MSAHRKWTIYVWLGVKRRCNPSRWFYLQGMSVKKTLWKLCIWRQKWVCSLVIGCDIKMINYAKLLSIFALLVQLVSYLISLLVQLVCILYTDKHSQRYKIVMFPNKHIELPFSYSSSLLEFSGNHSTAKGNCHLSCVFDCANTRTLTCHIPQWGKRAFSG